MQEILVLPLQDALVPFVMEKERPPYLEIGQKIKAARDAQGWTQEQLGEKLDVTGQAVQQWEDGSTKPKVSRAVKLSQVLGIPPSELWFGGLFVEQATPERSLQPMFSRNTGSANIRPVPPPAGKVPLISWVSAGHWDEAADPYAPGAAESWEPVEVRVSQRAFALRVRGDSMEPRFPDGCVIVVDPSAAVRSGDYVIARANDWDEATFKRYVVDAGIKYLKPLNPAYQTLQAGQDVSIVGKVIQWRFGGTLP